MSALKVVPFLLCMLALELSSMVSLSATYDERSHLALGRSVLERRPLEVPNQSTGISALNDLPRYALDALGLRLSEGAALFLSRLPTVFASLGLGMLVFLWSRELYGLRGALLSAAVYALCPTILAHAQLVTNDVYCGALMLAATWLFVRYLESPTTRRLLPWAIVTGVAQVAKPTALLLFPICAALWGLDALRGRAGVGFARSALSRGVAHAALALVTILVVMNAAYLFTGSLRPVHSYAEIYRSWSAVTREGSAVATLAWFGSRMPDVPVPLPWGYVHAIMVGMDYNATGGGHGPAYLLGRTSTLGWWYYFPVVLLLKTPIALLLLVAIAACVSSRWARARPLDETALALVPALVLVAFSAGCTAQMGIRYLIPMLPFFHVAVGKVAVYAPARFTAAYRMAIGALVLWMAGSVLSYHPHHLAYANELIGDRKNLYRYLADSNVDWGQNAYRLRRYLATLPPGAVAVNPAAPVSGRVIVNVNALVGVSAPRERYLWLRDGFAPVDHIGYSWLVFEVPTR